MENILKAFLMAFPEWLACIFMVVGLVVTALAAVRLGYGLVVAKTVYKWIVNAEEKFGAGAGAEKKAHVIAVLRGYTPDWLDWAINERTLDWIVQLVFDFTSMDCDGTKAGYDIGLTRAIADAVSIPVIASGGAGTLEHFYDALTEGGADAALAASLFHYKELEIRQVKEYLAGRGISVRR